MRRLEKRKWYCAQNPDPRHNTCEIPEENYEAPRPPRSAADVRLRRYLEGWVSRLKKIDAAEKRAIKDGATKRKRPEWITCSGCGKSRAVGRFVDGGELAVDGAWYCVLNTWDEALASCDAPEEAP